MKLWRKNKVTDWELPSFLISGLTRFHQWLIRMANFLQQKTNSYSVKKKKLLLLLFTIVFLTESSIVTIQSLQRRNNSPISIGRIKAVPIENNLSDVTVITREELQKIKRFKNYIDSLSTTAKGKKISDSLLQSHPHLMDSINFLIKLFSEQSKTN